MFTEGRTNDSQWGKGLLNAVDGAETSKPNCKCLPCELKFIMDIKIFSILPYLLAFTCARGPHHPRGEKNRKKGIPTKDTNEKLTEDAQLLHDKEHIQEHLEEVIPEPDLSNMTDEELEFYYFQVHDSDKNSKLDGLEILQAISHTGQHEYEDDGNEIAEKPADDFNYYVELIDQVLKEDDLDQDGYLSYSEYVGGRRHNKYKHINKTPTVKMIP
ncbi:hypothetical protein NQ318_006368 [Aromia moschata]|uniref:EF-hand domain-containing protein n=1 Tax=Aromia moschata TaxID=1265417 RepID=A0AAV8YJB7_9CUCU|nr:hypothetical protein NQ318_006368 [Aromia moschata]